MWEKLLSKKRFYSIDNIKVDSNEEFFRTSFHKDYDRLIFSNAFRRLAKKTQVHPLSKNDHVHNRLTHSLEVASVGRSLGLSAGKVLQNKGYDIEPYDIAYIIQTACLAHDIGNPPFGHAGEEVIKEWFKKHENKDFLKSLSKDQHSDFQHLDGNAQSFRIVTQLENNLFSGGMNLSFATLGTLVKYPYSSSHCKTIGKSKFNYFHSEEGFFKLLFTELGLKASDGRYKRHPLSYLMEAADDICYGLLDLQDAIELKIVNLGDVEQIFNLLCGEQERQKTYSNSAYSDVQKLSKLVAKAMNELALQVMDVFEHKLEVIEGDEQPKGLIELFSNTKLKQGILDAKQLASDKVFNEIRKVELELGAYNIIETILDHLIRATYEFYSLKDMKLLSFRNKRALELMGKNKPLITQSLFEMYQRVVDYLVGMTDNHARHVANQLNGTGN
ncbi:MAG: deoxyguanosinetriphosphate triphosphohydrolase [Methylococcaceae bacterium]|nr:deoxyguanosinetriphosphate triphosphohydrolase [Methylococcaceae bacterium]